MNQGPGSAGSRARAGAGGGQSGVGGGQSGGGRLFVVATPIGNL